MISGLSFNLAFPATKYHGAATAARIWVVPTAPHAVPTICLDILLVQKTDGWSVDSNDFTRTNVPKGHQVWSNLTQFHSVDFSPSRIGVAKCFFYKCTIKVFVSCC